MKKIFIFSLFILQVSVNEIFTQINLLRQEIASILQSKKAEVGVAILS